MMTKFKTFAPKGSYPQQWWWCAAEESFYFKRNPLWAVGRDEFDVRFFLWTDIDRKTGKPSDAVISNFGNHVDGRLYDEDEIAGVVIRDGKRMLNVHRTESKIAA